MPLVTSPAGGDPIDAAWGIAVSNLVNDRAAIVAATGNITTTQTQVVGLTIAANKLAAGSCYRVECWGTVTSSGVNGVTIRVRLGTTTLTGAIVAERTPNATATASVDPFRFSALVTVRTAGAGGTAIGAAETMGQAAQPFNTQTFTNVETTTDAVDTTVANILELTIVTAAAGTSVNVRQAVIERIA